MATNGWSLIFVSITTAFCFGQIIPLWHWSIKLKYFACFCIYSCTKTIPISLRHCKQEVVHISDLSWFLLFSLKILHAKQKQPTTVLCLHKICLHSEQGENVFDFRFVFVGKGFPPLRGGCSAKNGVCKDEGFCLACLPTRLVNQDRDEHLTK